MIVSELVSLLGFKVDPSGAQQFDRMLGQMQKRTDAFVTGIGVSIGNKVTDAIMGMASSFNAALANIPKAGDAMATSLQKIESSIGRSATSGEEAAGIYDKLYEVGKQTGVSADESAGAFTRFNLAMQDLKRPASDTIDLISGIQAAGIVAGTTTSELTATMLQLGQALGSGKLQGEELNSLRENMPRFLRDVMKSMNMTSEAFFKAAEKGELKPALLVPAMLKASEAARNELANFPLSMARSFSILQNAASRFAAELDKQLGLSKAIAKAFAWVARTLDSWRSRLSVVGDWVRDLGGLEGIIRVVGFALLAAFGGVLIGAIGAAGAAVLAFGSALLAAALPLAGIAAWALVLEDAFSWMQGKDSLFGRRFGEFEDVIAPLKAAMETAKAVVMDAIAGIQADWTKLSADLKPVTDTIVAILIFLKDAFVSVGTGVVELIDKLISQWNRGVGGMKPQIDWMISAAGLIMDAFRPLGAFFDGVLNAIIGRFSALYDRIASFAAGVRSLIPGFAAATEGAGDGATSDPEAQAERRARMGGRGALGGFGGDALQGFGMPMPDMSGRVSGVPTINAPQSNTMTNNVTVNAPGADPASVANATSSGVTRGGQNLLSDLSRLSLGLGTANPAVEARPTP